LAVLLATPAARAQFWEKKPWKEWSKGDAKKMLEDSPWAKKWQIGQSQQVTFGQPTGGTGDQGSSQIWYIIQLRSARPIREGVFREMQLNSQYSKMSDAEKKAFDEQGEGFISKSYEDSILVHVVYGSNQQPIEREMARHWQGYPAGTVPMGANLISSRNVRVGVARLISPPGATYEFEMVFPRLVNGEPWITPEDKRLRVEFPHPAVGGMGSARVFVEFNLEKMKIGDKLEY
jgi:hypothetical protein